jgi:tRNA pseudouridine38-40 synthase
MANFKLVLEYEGTNYRGWQIQNHSPLTANRKPNSRTIQGEIEGVLAKLFGKKIRLIGSGRTDSGVHALGQVANFKCETKLKTKNIRSGLNSFLPDDIRILKVTEAPDDFHARFSCRSKTYRYLILNRKTNSVFYRRFSWWIPYRLDFSLMRQAAKIFLGRHDFKAFAGSDSKRKSDNFVRTIRRVGLRKYKDFIVFDIEADGFLYNMVRNIVGTLVEVGRGKLTAQDLKQILISYDRELAGPTAPACGLFLVRVKYV